MAGGNNDDDEARGTTMVLGAKASDDVGLGMMKIDLIFLL